jgi:hypothetical protein
MTTSTLKKHISDVLREYRLNRKGTAAAFIRQYRKFAAIPGLSKTRALDLAKDTFPAEYKAYCNAQERGEQLPPLDGQKPDYQQRLAAMVANGGRLN